jgi:CheY-like chemotaxis protein
MRHTLLLADDSVTIQRVIELTFADEEVDVVAVSNGDEAIACLEASPPPDIVLADIGMPGRNGYQVAQYVKQSPRLAHIPVVLLTGAFEPVDQARAQEAGCDGILAKPFEPQLVIGRVKELLAKPRGATRPPLDEHAAPPPAAAPNGDLGEYFDRLDAAFASLSSVASHQSSVVSPESSVSSRESSVSSRESSVSSRESSVFSRESPVSSRESSVFSRESPVSSRESSVRGPESLAAPPPLPPRADAFAALLAAEQHESPSPAAPLWPASRQPAPAITDEAIEQIVRHVLARLSDQVVRETVADIVSTIAERLVREEIERIKASMK